MDTAAAEFSELMQSLGCSKGAPTKEATYRLFGDLLRWLMDEGHGEVTLTAIDNRFGERFRANTVVTVGRRRKAE